MKRTIALLAALLLLSPAAAQLGSYPGPKIEKLDQPAKEIPNTLEWWGSSKRPQLVDYRKKVVVLLFWTNEDIASNKNFMFYGKWKKAYEDQGLSLIGIHVPPKVAQPPAAVKGMMPESARAAEAAKVAKIEAGAHEKAKTFVGLFPTVFAKDDSYLAALAGDAKLVDFTGPGAGAHVEVRAVPAVPTFFLIDRKGKLRYRVQDVIAFDAKSYEDKVTDKIESLLREPKE